MFSRKISFVVLLLILAAPFVFVSSTTVDAAPPDPDIISITESPNNTAIVFKKGHASLKAVEKALAKTKIDVTLKKRLLESIGQQQAPVKLGPAKLQSPSFHPGGDGFFDVVHNFDCPFGWVGFTFKDLTLFGVGTAWVSTFRNPAIEVIGFANGVCVVDCTVFHITLPVPWERIWDHRLQSPEAFQTQGAHACFPV